MHQQLERIEMVDTQRMAQRQSLQSSSNRTSTSYALALSRQQKNIAAVLNNVGTLLYKRGEDSAAMVLYHHSLESVGVQARAGLQYSCAQRDHATLPSEQRAVELSRLLSLPAEPRAAQMSQLVASLEQEIVDMAVPHTQILLDGLCEIGMESFSTEPITIDSRARCCNRNETEPPEVTSDQSFKTLYNMGLVKSKAGDTREAKLLYEQVLMHISSSQDYPDVGLLCLHHLGRIHYTKQRYGEALHCFSSVISGGQERGANLQSGARTTSVVSYYHQLVARTMVCVAKTFMQMEELEGSLACCQEALSLRRAALAHDHMGIATANYVVGLVYQNQENLVEARTHYDQFLRQALFDLGDLHPHVATVRQKIGEVLLEEGLDNESLPFFRSALGARLQVHGENNPDVGRTIFCIGRAYHELHNYVDALELYKQALVIEEACIENDSQVVNILCNIGQVYHLNGNLDEALDTYMRAVCFRFNEHMPFILRQIGNILVEKREVRIAMTFFVKAQRLLDAFDVDYVDDDSTRLALLLSVRESPVPNSPAA